MHPCRLTATHPWFNGPGMTATTASAAHRPLLPILLALSGAHLLNDLIQSMIPALYPLLKETYALDFAQIGLITLAFQVTSSLLQPVLGFVTDKRPWPYAMVAGMTATLAGLLGLAYAANYTMVLVSAAMVGLGSAVFHPEATRMAGTRPPGNRVSHKAFSRSAGMPDMRSDRCSPQPSSCRAVRPVSPGPRSWRSWPWR